MSQRIGIAFVSIPWLEPPAAAPTTTMSEEFRKKAIPTDAEFCRDFVRVQHQKNWTMKIIKEKAQKYSGIVVPTDNKRDSEMFAFVKEPQKNSDVH